MAINELYDNLCNRIVMDINASGLPICCIRDILRGLYEEAQQKYTLTVQQEKMAAAEKTQASDSADSAVSEADAQTGPESTVTSEVIPNA